MSYLLEDMEKWARYGEGRDGKKHLLDNHLATKLSLHEGKIKDAVFGKTKKSLYGGTIEKGENRFDQMMAAFDDMDNEEVKEIYGLDDKTAKKRYRVAAAKAAARPALIAAGLGGAAYLTHKGLKKQAALEKWAEDNKEGQEKLADDIAQFGRAKYLREAKESAKILKELYKERDDYPTRYAKALKDTQEKSDEGWRAWRLDKSMKEAYESIKNEARAEARAEAFNLKASSPTIAKPKVNIPDAVSPTIAKPKVNIPDAVSPKERYDSIVNQAAAAKKKQTALKAGAGLGLGALAVGGGLYTYNRYKKNKKEDQEKVALLADPNSMWKDPSKPTTLLNALKTQKPRGTTAPTPDYVKGTGRPRPTGLENMMKGRNRY